MQTKICRTCQIEKPNDAFQSGHRQCRKCHNAVTRQWKADNRDRIKAYNKARYDKAAHTQREREYRQSDKGKAREERYRERKNALAKINRQTAKAKATRQRHYDRTKNDPQTHIKRSLSRRLNSALGKGHRKQTVETMLGCSLVQLRVHLESLWQPGMSWETYGSKGWHIDHIRPCVSFDLTDPEQQKACFHYTNLQPLWAEDNIRKKDKVMVETGFKRGREVRGHQFISWGSAPRTYCTPPRGWVG